MYMEKNNGLHGGAILVSEEAILTEINGNWQCFYLLLWFSQEHYKSTNESDKKVK
jgi:hypothetical protein